MTIHYYTASSLDGFIATTDHSLQWLFEQDFDTDGPMSYTTFIEGIGALALGASTWDWLQSQDDPWEYTQPAWVFTHREREAPAGADIRFVQGSPADHIGSILEAAGERDVWVIGGGDLAGQFADAGLLTDVWVQFAPVTLGSGQPLLPRDLKLDLVDVVRNRDFACTHYRVRREG